MPTMNRNGFSLIELIMALGLGAAVATVVFQAIVNTQRATQAGTQQVDVRQNLRAGVGYLASVIRELNAAENDIVVATGTQLQFRSMRWTGILCTAPVAASMTVVTMPVRRDLIYGVRGPSAALDSVFVFVDGDPTTRADDAWLAGGVTAVAAGNCADGSPSADLSVEIPLLAGGSAAVVAGVTLGSPLRGFQLEELTLLSTGGRWWLAQRTASRAGAWTTPLPLVGPLAAGGMTLAYFDSTGAAAGTITDIASIAVLLRGESRNRVRQSVATTDFARDSLISRVALRNNPRF